MQGTGSYILPCRGHESNQMHIIGPWALGPGGEGRGRCSFSTTSGSVSPVISQSSLPKPFRKPYLPSPSNSSLSHSFLLSMSEIKGQNPEDTPVNPKRKTDPESLTPDPKKQKSDYPNAEQRNSDGGTDEAKEGEGEEKNFASNGKAAIDKGKAVVVENKGKGKLLVTDTDSNSSSGGEECLEEDGEDNESLDDPLAEVDLSNILPSRTRRRVADPGAYLRVIDVDTFILTGSSIFLIRYL
ncbi:hypothetical protein H6P81_012383 [Aristolochia fimbriata]|uniref:Histone chaperone domain-containing protein n=1 Tax=Aristolochia fimbriata TaxID=158543 RepID=A0AAV7EBN8_ARIFI|nr:hypothetical protein H6P81_012383 [Aristolochia fimbriata]